MAEEILPSKNNASRAVGTKPQRGPRVEMRMADAEITREMLRHAYKAPHAFDRELSEEKIEAQKKLVEVQGRRAFFALRSSWSGWIIFWISCFILFHVVLTFCIGLGSLNFEKYQWLIPLIVVENFLQICGMGYIVVQFLYPPEKAKDIAKNVSARD